MKILILGSKGMLGSECCNVLGQEYEMISPDRKELDIRSWDMVIESLHRISPKIIINCAGFTDVDACEKEDFLVRKINIEGPRNLAQGSARFNCKLIHISSDYVFNGQKTVPQPYFEDDATAPLSAYGRSKLESEIAVKENAPNYIILRTGWLYGRHRKNFVRSFLANVFDKKGKAVKIVNDQFGSPTWAYRLALQIKTMLEGDALGTYHVTTEGYCSRLEFARHILDRLRIDVDLEPCSMKDCSQSAKRPVNCILENRRAKKQGLNVMTDWQEDLDAFLEKFGGDLIEEAKGNRAS
ncbi:MAG: dTDP-4-dehydrorhamnose reductase [Desulfatiglandales bacterium]